MQEATHPEACIPWYWNVRCFEASYSWWTTRWRWEMEERQWTIVLTSDPFSTRSIRWLELQHLPANSRCYHNHKNCHCHQRGHSSIHVSSCWLWPCQWLPMWGFCVNGFSQEPDVPFQVTNTSSTYSALPPIQREMNLELAQVQWIVSAYPLSSVSNPIRKSSEQF